MKRLWLVILVAAAAIGSVVGWVMATPVATPASNPDHYPTLARGHPAPTFSLPRLGGGPSVTSATDTGTPLVINFFASWCPNCAAELSTFGSVASAAGGRVAFIGIDSNDGDGGAAKTMLARAHVGYPVGVDPSAHVAVDYRVVGLPTTFFVNGKGQVVGEAFGTQSAQSLRAWVADLER